jgi:hypothetical protein
MIHRKPLLGAQLTLLHTGVPRNYARIVRALEAQGQPVARVTTR